MKEEEMKYLYKDFKIFKHKDFSLYLVETYNGGNTPLYLKRDGYLVDVIIYGQIDNLSFFSSIEECFDAIKLFKLTKQKNKSDLIEVDINNYLKNKGKKMIGENNENNESTYTIGHGAKLEISRVRTIEDLEEEAKAIVDKLIKNYDSREINKIIKRIVFILQQMRRDEINEQNAMLKEKEEVIKEMIEWASSGNER